jgi:AcrR family transcriptional regulator
MGAHIPSVAKRPRKAHRRQRRRPRQRRAHLTVEAVLDAVVKILKKEGVTAVTTNRIAEVAGVSIGSVYQYFPDKRAIYIALHTRHVEQVDRLVERTLIEEANAPLARLIRAMIEAMVTAHAADPELYHLLMAEVPHRGDGTRDFASRLHGAFRLALLARSHELKLEHDLDLKAFVVAQMVDALAHASVLRRPEGVSVGAAQEQAVRAVLGYLGV